MARITLQEAADKLGLSMRTLRRRIKEGRLHAELEEGKYYIGLTEVERFGNEVKLHAAKTVTLDKEDYDSLIFRLETLEKQFRYVEKLLEALRKS